MGLPSTEPDARNYPPESKTALEPAASERDEKLRAFPTTRHYSAQMPEISRFFGIVVTMYYNDHDPPHFHVRYGEKRAIIAIESLKVLDGALPTRALGLVLEWVSMHRDELDANWRLARAKQPLESIAPLE